MAAPIWQGAALEELTGCAVHPLELEALLAQIESRWRIGDRRLMVGSHNFNSLALVQHDPDMRAFYRRCEWCYVDGVPVLWLMRMAGLSTRGAVRFSLMDQFVDLLQWAADRNLRLFYLGSTPDSVASGRAWIERRFPGLAAAFHHGYFEDDSAMVEDINRFAPDLLLVGMGMPRQERWMLEHRETLNVGALLQAGGTLDYYSGVQPRPPGWMSRLGLGGIYRLVRSPSRLWRRYLVGPWSLIKPTLRLRRRLRRC